MVTHGGQYVRLHLCWLQLPNKLEKKLSIQDIRHNENAEIQKSNNVTPENYLNGDLNINVSQFLENGDNDEKIVSIKCKEVDRDINELTTSISDLSLNT